MRDAESGEEEEEEQEEEEITEEYFKNKNKKGKKGRRNQWPEHLVDDLVDIILENDKYKEVVIDKCEKRKVWSTLFKSKC